MSGATTTDDTNEYAEREAVAVFDSEAALDAAVDGLMQIGLRQEDMSVVASAAKLTPKESASRIEDADDTQRGDYIDKDARTEGAVAMTGGPALIAGLGAALFAGVAGAALIPAIAVTVAGTAAAGTVGLLFARAFGRKHAAYVAEQIENGGLLLWVHAPDDQNDAKIAAVLTKAGGRDVHFHVVNRSWGIADVPFHDAEPDPLLRS